MPVAEPVSIEVGDIRLVRPDRDEISLGQLPGVNVVVLLRHRH